SSPIFIQGVMAWALMATMPNPASAGRLPPIQTVFIVVMENQDWSAIKNSPDAPFINQALLPAAAHCEDYHHPPGLRPSLPNYLWLEAGTNFGVRDNNDPAFNHQATTNHLTVQLDRAGISWKTYQEDITGLEVPLTAVNGYAPKHNPFVYFDDVTGTNDPANAYGIAHNRPYSELAADLTNQTVARYNFITPNLCHGGHDACEPSYNSVRQSDDWLAQEIPKILASAAYTNGGALFITWDECALSGEATSGMIVLSPFVRAAGYSSSSFFTHSSTLRTVQEIFGVGPFLGDAENANDLGDLFQGLRITNAQKLAEGGFQLAVEMRPGTTNVGQVSDDLLQWISISTNSGLTNAFIFVDTAATNSPQRFYRFLQLD
ncbi:MAG: alkaline phosphatase family protein, partial [Verrucomicrobiota bacterium]